MPHFAETLSIILDMLSRSKFISLKADIAAWYEVGLYVL